MTTSRRSTQVRYAPPAGNRASSDVDHYDDLSVLRDRIFGLRCAIGGAQFASAIDRSGLLRLVEDLTDSAADLCRKYATDRAVKAPMARDAGSPS